MSDPKVIIVIGDVPAEAYESLRLHYAEQGDTVEVKKIQGDWIADVDDSEEDICVGGPDDDLTPNDTDFLQAQLLDLCEAADIMPAAVVEVVRLESDWADAVGGCHAFAPPHEGFWPNWKSDVVLV